MTNTVSVYMLTFAVYQIKRVSTTYWCKKTRYCTLKGNLCSGEYYWFWNSYWYL